MRYLLRFRDPGLGDLWTDLLPKIPAILKEKSVIYSYDRPELRLVGEMRFIPPAFRDALDRPPFSDAPKSTYLVMGYENSDISALRSLGLQDLSKTTLLTESIRTLDPIPPGSDQTRHP